MTFEELIENNDFRKWVLSGQKMHQQDWDSKIKSDEDAALIQEAATFVRQLQFKKEQLPTSEIEHAWKQLEERINTPETETPVVSIGRRTWIRRVAAVIVLALVSTSTLFLFNKRSKVSAQNTDFGEQLSFTLADQSSIQLNANSEITFDKQFNEGQTRRVELKGQAFFDVQSLPSKEKFEVKTEYFTVEVLGTQFDVIARADKARVVLKEGKVNVAFESPQIVVTNNIAQSTQRVTLQPGEELRLMDGKYYQNQVNASQKISWTAKKLHFDNTSLAEVANLIKDYYGYDVEFSAAHLKTEKVSGTFPINNQEVFLQSIEEIFNIKVKKVSKTRLMFVK